MGFGEQQRENPGGGPEGYCGAFLQAPHECVGLGQLGNTEFFQDRLQDMLTFPKHSPCTAAIRPEDLLFKATMLAVQHLG